MAALATLALLTILAPLPLAHAAPALAPALAPASLPRTVSLQPSLPSPQPVETPLIWTASATATGTVPLVYRFSVATAPAGPFLVVRDFYTRDSFAWAPLVAATYYIQVNVKEGYTGTATTTATASFTLLSRVTQGQPVVSPTANPLVALYSTPACAAGQMAVRFTPVGGTVWTSTNTQQCHSGQDLNFLVAGMLPSTTYQLESVLDANGVVTTSPPLSFTTGSLPTYLIYPQFTVPVSPTAQSDHSAYITFHSLLYVLPYAVNPVATNLKGSIIWYAHEPDIGSYYATRIQPVGGPLGAVVTLQGQGTPGPHFATILRVIDLAGNPLQETNVFAVDQKLQALGQQGIYGFDHESYYLPNGDLVVIGYIQRWATTKTGIKSYLSDMVLVLNPNLEVVWTWNAFDHLDVHRGPTMGDKCVWSYPVAACPGGAGTIDWTHMNAVDYTADGNLLLSLRAQDWVIKVNYNSGAGDGRVLWRLGKDGDFKLLPLNPLDPYPWFSHQHDANFLDPTTLALFDNGNTRCWHTSPPCNSRGQVYTINEQTLVVTQTVNTDLGHYADALGTAQRLANGNFDFTLGAETSISGGQTQYSAQDIEVLPDGAQVYVQQVTQREYRAWRLASLDATLNPPCPSCST